MILIDANLLIYAYDSSSEHHQAARLWLEDVFSGYLIPGQLHNRYQTVSPKFSSDSSRTSTIPSEYITRMSPGSSETEPWLYVAFGKTPRPGPVWSSRIMGRRFALNKSGRT